MTPLWCLCLWPTLEGGRQLTGCSEKITVEGKRPDDLWKTTTIKILAVCLSLNELGSVDLISLKIIRILPV